MIKFDIKLLIDFIEEGKTAEEIANAYGMDAKEIKSVIHWLLHLKEGCKPAIEKRIYNRDKIDEDAVYNILTSKEYRMLHNIKILRNKNNEPVIEHLDNVKSQKTIVQVDDKYFVIRSWGKKAKLCHKQIALEVIDVDGHWKLKYD